MTLAHTFGGYLRADVCDGMFTTGSLEALLLLEMIDIATR